MPRAKMLRSQWLGTACEQATALRQPALVSPLTSSWSRRGTAPARPWRSTSDLWRAGGRQVCFDYSAINISRPSIRTGRNRLEAAVPQCPLLSRLSRRQASVKCPWSALERGCRRRNWQILHSAPVPHRHPIQRALKTRRSCSRVASTHIWLHSLYISWSYTCVSDHGASVGRT